MEDLHNSIIILDKPINYDSHQATALVKRMLNIEKIGHSGTLDPKVTGILILLLGKSVKLTSYLLKQDKEYIGIMYLHKDVGLKELQEKIKSFTGKIKQLPPVRSSVKRQERERNVYSFKIIEKNGKNVLFRVNCQAGTYIRKLVNDLGIELGGAHMLELRRTKESNFAEKDCVSMYEIAEAVKNNQVSKILTPASKIIEKMPKIFIKKEFIYKITNGSPVYKEYILKRDKFKKKDFVAVFLNAELLEIATAVLEGNVVAKPQTVLKSM